jgi:hypothetical protein
MDSLDEHDSACHFLVSDAAKKRLLNPKASSMDFRYFLVSALIIEIMDSITSGLKNINNQLEDFWQT